MMTDEYGCVFDESTLKDELNAAYSMSTKPDESAFPKYDVCAVIDENKSVKWNREQIEYANLRYQSEEACLKAIKQDKTASAIKHICHWIADEVQCSETKARLIWDKAYEYGHSAGVNEIFIYINEYIDFAYKLLHLEEY